jgi:hypothetical protein
MIRSYSQYMLQRLTDAPAALAPERRATVTEPLAGKGWEPTREVSLTRRVRKPNVIHWRCLSRDVRPRWRHGKREGIID